jgi:pumilio family protein 6
MLKALVSSGRFNPDTKSVELVEPRLGFADTLYANIEKDITQWATGANSFVVLSLLESRDFSKLDTLKAELKKERKALEKAGGPKSNGVGKGGRKEKSKNGMEGKAESNRGAQLLLEMLD